MFGLIVVVTINAVAAATGLAALIIRKPQDALLFAAVMLTTGGCFFTLSTTVVYWFAYNEIVAIMTSETNWMLSRIVQATGALTFHAICLRDAAREAHTNKDAAEWTR